MAKIACRLPHGIYLHDPRDYSKRVHIKGLKHTPSRLVLPESVRIDMPIFGIESYSITEVDDEFWARWVEVNGKTFEPFIKGGIFYVKNDNEANHKVRDSDKSGFEPIDPAKIKVEGVKAFDETKV